MKQKKFMSFIFQKSQWLDWGIMITGFIFSYIFLRYFYPYPSAMSDSSYYIMVAQNNTFYPLRPFGYSYFLHLIHLFSNNVHSIFAVQMFIFFISTAFCAFTVKYFYAPAKKWLWVIALLFFTFTPTGFYLCNMVLSDLLFSAQTYFLLGLFIFIIKQKNIWALILFLLVLFSALNVRFSAMVYPIIFIPAVLMLKGYIRVLTPALIIVVFIIFLTQQKENMQETVQLDQSSTGFDGWSLLNNACYILPHIDIKSNDIKNSRLRSFHSFLMLNIDTIAKVAKPRNGYETHTALMWGNQYPLRTYMYMRMQAENQPFLRMRSKLGAGLYKDYATYMIIHYPFAFFKYFYRYNMIQSFYPSLFALDEYKKNGWDKFSFDYYDNIDENTDFKPRYDIWKYYIGPFMQKTNLLIWIGLFVLCIIAIIKRKQIIFSKTDKMIFWTMFAFIVVYYVLNIATATMELRYFLPTYFIKFFIAYILLNNLLLVKKV